MVDIATLGLSVTSKPVEQGARALDVLVGAAKRADAAALGLDSSMQGAASAVARVTAASDAQVGNLTRSTAALRANSTALKAQAQVAKTASFQTANFVAQINDVIVTLAAGQSPFQVMLQQGSQISQIFGPGTGVSGALGLLRSSILSMLNPISLATYAIIGLGGAAISYFTSGAEEADDLNEAIKAHSDLVRRVKDAWGDAAKGLDEYVEESRSMLFSEAEKSVRDLQKALQDAAIDVRAFLASYGAPGLERGRFHEFNDAITEFLQGIEDGAPNVRRFRQEVNEIAAGNASARVRALADELLSVTEKARDAQGNLLSAQNVVDTLREATEAATPRLLDYANALAAISDALPASLGGGFLSDGQSLIDGIQQRVEGLVGSVKGMAGLNSLVMGILRPEDPNAPIPRTNPLRDLTTETEPSRGGKSEADRVREQMERRLEALRQGLLTEEEAERNSFASRMTAMKDFYDAGLISQQEYNEMAVAAEADHASKIAKIQEQMAREQRMNATRNLDTALGIAGEITSALGTIFEDNKGLAVAGALINTAQAVTKTLAEYGATPWGFAAAAAAAAAGAAQIATIMRTNKDGGGGSSVPRVGGAAGGGAAQPQPQAPAAVPQQAIYVNLQGQSFGREQVRELIEQINEASRDGAKLLVSAA